MSSIHIPGLLRPIIALNGWTFVMEIWMYATRIPVFQHLKEAGDPSSTRSELEAKTPPSVRWKADNFNHLFEQPTQFYAVALALAIARRGEDNPMDVTLAWGYVGARILHSLIQSTSNKIMVRFGVFLISSGILAVMTGRAALLVF
ncbi:membrane-associated, eicosanoid/glutathione metabolism protein [Aspergillus cavernicola]|uniref:Membrane-associated, eicosanoid/glutathione metabolism protein n=1 Tax=Aspergillus cavernicola TaxID=176166 RepID=A0ABR4HUB0_9EURO